MGGERTALTSRLKSLPDQGHTGAGSLSRRREPAAEDLLPGVPVQAEAGFQKSQAPGTWKDAPCHARTLLAPDQVPFANANADASPAPGSPLCPAEPAPHEAPGRHLTAQRAARTRRCQTGSRTKREKRPNVCLTVPGLGFRSEVGRKRSGVGLQLLTRLSNYTGNET